MITLPEPPRLREPHTGVRISSLTGEQADMLRRGADAEWLGPASRDPCSLGPDAAPRRPGTGEQGPIEAFVAERIGVVERWGVPSTLLWYTSGPHYLASLVIRHRLLEDGHGGHIGYHVVAPWQRQGHATRMLAEGLEVAAGLGVGPALLTVAPDNAWSRRVVLANGGTPDGRNAEGEDRFWIAR